jgi:CHASE2 domain-containing sensor protein
MVRHSLWHWATFAFLLWIPFWVLYGKVRAYRLSGYRFYLITGLIVSIPYFFLALVFYYSPGYSIIPFLLVIVVSRLGLEWGMDQEEKAGRDDPERWKVWQARTSAQNWIGRLFL